MKKVLFVLCLLVLGCDNSNQVTVCSCKKLSEEKKAKIKDAEDQETRTSIQLEYKKKYAACEKWATKQLKGLSDEARRQKLEEWNKKKCD